MAAHQSSAPTVLSGWPSFERSKQKIPAPAKPILIAAAVATFLMLVGWCVLEIARVAAAIRQPNYNLEALQALQRLSALMGTIALSFVGYAVIVNKRWTQQKNELCASQAACRDAEQQAKSFQRDFLAAQQSFRTLFDHATEGYLLIDDGRIVECSASVVLMLRVKTKDQIVGRSLNDFATPMQPGGESSSVLLQRCNELARHKGKRRLNCLYLRQDGSELHVDLSCTTMPLDGKNVLLVAWRDLTERCEAEEALLRSAARLRVAQAIAHLGHWEYDPRTDRVLWSEEALRIFGFASPTESPTLQSCFHRIHPEDRPSAESAFGAAIRRGKPAEIYFRILLPDGNIRHVDSRSRSDLNSAGKAVRVSGTILDITEQKQVEAQLRQNLSEKELLVKEVHHRVKNNLQVVSSLLSMQTELLEDEDSIQALRESQHRISSMALIHERLYSHGNIDNIDFAEYTEALVQELFHAYGKQAQYIYKSLDLAPVSLNIEKAIPCGLILNELVTNALKHAFPSGRGTLKVTLKSQSKERMSLCVSDSGIGLPENLDLKDSKSLGLPLVEVLARQLGGVLHVQAKPGATFTVEFPVFGVT